MPEQVELSRPAPTPAHLLSVTSIEWVRAQLTIRVRLTRPDSMSAAEWPRTAFYLVDGSRTMEVPADSTGEGEFALSIRVTAFGGRRFIPDGSWRLQALLDNGVVLVAAFDGDFLPRLDDASRVFLFNANLSALTVSFDIDENGQQLDFVLHSFLLSRGSRESELSSGKRFGGVRSSVKLRIANWIFLAFLRLIGPKRGRILFASDRRASMEGNLRRVHERLVERGLDEMFDLRTSFRLPKTTRWPTTIHALYLLATSEIVLLDDYFALLEGLKVGHRQRVIQLWHAGSGFKSVGYARFGRSGSPGLWDPHRQYTYAITGSANLVPVYAEVFGIEESAVIPTGLPRVDYFLDEDRKHAFIQRFYSENPSLRGKRIILFAPTYRGSDISDAFYDYSLIDFDALYEACGPDTVVLFRMHHFVRESVPIPAKYRENFFDFSRFDDGMGLLHVTDLLITDYSSIIYEYSLLDRPMLFFAPDKLNYSAVHGFHRPYDETAPGPVYVTFADLVTGISSGVYERSKIAHFRAQNFDRIDTGSADRVIDWLILGSPGANSPQGPAPDEKSETSSATSARVLQREDETS